VCVTYPVSSYPAVAPTMVLDGVTLLNLEVLENTVDGSEKGTLYGILKHTVTSMGHRCLREWVRAPLLLPRDINRRCVCVLVWCCTLETPRSCSCVRDRLDVVECFLGPLAPAADEARRVRVVCVQLIPPSHHPTPLHPAHDIWTHTGPQRTRRPGETAGAHPCTGIEEACGGPPCGSRSAV
jgi:hypothetical protein